MGKIILCMCLLIIFCSKQVYSQQIAKWDGSSGTLKFSCGKSMNFRGKIHDLNFYVGISKMQVRIGEKKYRKFIFGYDSTKIAGHIRINRDTIFLCNGKSYKEVPFLTISKKEKKFKSVIQPRLNGIFNGYMTIKQDTSLPKGIISEKNKNAMMFNIIPEKTDDAGYISAIVINELGIVGVNIVSGIGATSKCKCDW